MKYFLTAFLVLALVLGAGCANCPQTAEDTITQWQKLPIGKKLAVIQEQIVRTAGLIDEIHAAGVLDAEKYEEAKDRLVEAVRIYNVAVSLYELDQPDLSSEQADAAEEALDILTDLLATYLANTNTNDS